MSQANLAQIILDMDDIDITADCIDETMERTVEKAEILVDILN